jgi:hypothetical protein
MWGRIANSDNLRCMGIVNLSTRMTEKNLRETLPLEVNGRSLLGVLFSLFGTRGGLLGQIWTLAGAVILVGRSGNPASVSAHMAFRFQSRKPRSHLPWWLCLDPWSTRLKIIPTSTFGTMWPCQVSLVRHVEFDSDAIQAPHTRLHETSSPRSLLMKPSAEPPLQ